MNDLSSSFITLTFKHLEGYSFFTWQNPWLMMRPQEILVGWINIWTKIVWMKKLVKLFDDFFPLFCCCCLSAIKACLTLCDPVDCSTPGSPALHYILELAQMHVHWVSDAIQPSHPLSAPSPFAFNLAQHQGLFQWVSSSHQVAKVLELQLSFSLSAMIFLNWRMC